MVGFCELPLTLYLAHRDSLFSKLRGFISNAPISEAKRKRILADLLADHNRRKDITFKAMHNHIECRPEVDGRSSSALPALGGALSCEHMAE